MVSKRSLDRLLAKRLSGEEVARLVLRNYADERAGKEPTFSETEIERAKAALCGRPREAAVYNAWVEVPRIIDYVSMDALVKALGSEKALSVLTLSVVHLLRLSSLRRAEREATKVLTPEEWESFPARREEARWARIAVERVSLAEVIGSRAWQLAPEDIKDRAQALPGFDDDDGNEYDCLLEMDKAVALSLRTAAEAEIAALAEAGRLRFARSGSDVSALIRTGWRDGLTGEEAEAFEDEAECGLPELVDAGLPEWVEHAEAEWLTPPEFRGPVAVLQEVPPGCLDGNERFVEPGWTAVEDVIRREATPERLEQLRSMVDACGALLRAFLARRTIIEVFAEELGLDLLPSFVWEREEVLRGLVTHYNVLAALSRQGEPDEDGFVAAEWTLVLPRSLRLSPIKLKELEPNPGEVNILREALEVPDAQVWWEAALERCVAGALGTADPELEEQVQQHGREPDSFNITANGLMA